jgi:hypothetical protein
MTYHFLLNIVLIVIAVGAAPVREETRSACANPPDTSCDDGDLKAALRSAVEKVLWHPSRSRRPW